jgi:hypothetical protein
VEVELLLPGQLQLLVLIQDGVLQPLSEDPVDWQPVAPPTMKPIPRTPTNVHRESETRILVILHWFRHSIAGNSFWRPLAQSGATLLFGRAIYFRRTAPEYFN